VSNDRVRESFGRPEPLCFHGRTLARHPSRLVPDASATACFGDEPQVGGVGVAVGAGRGRGVAVEARARTARPRRAAGFEHTGPDRATVSPGSSASRRGSSARRAVASRRRQGHRETALQLRARRCGSGSRSTSICCYRSRSCRRGLMARSISARSRGRVRRQRRGCEAQRRFRSRSRRANPRAKPRPASSSSSAHVRRGCTVRFVDASGAGSRRRGSRSAGLGGTDKRCAGQYSCVSRRPSCDSRHPDGYGSLSGPPPPQRRAALRLRARSEAIVVRSRRHRSQDQPVAGGS